uniref:Uncharacterized protein n=1 Tax=Ditylenchus dipsaci TaxID=166011 RepID=A0A915DQK8_9BILA
MKYLLCKEEEELQWRVVKEVARAKEYGKKVDISEREARDHVRIFRNNALQPWLVHKSQYLTELEGVCNQLGILERDIKVMDNKIAKRKKIARKLQKKYSGNQKAAC